MCIRCVRNIVTSLVVITSMMNSPVKPQYANEIFAQNVKMMVDIVFVKVYSKPIPRFFSRGKRKIKSTVNGNNPIYSNKSWFCPSYTADGSSLPC